MVTVNIKNFSASLRTEFSHKVAKSQRKMVTHFEIAV